MQASLTKVEKQSTLNYISKINQESQNPFILLSIYYRFEKVILREKARNSTLSFDEVLVRAYQNLGNEGFEGLLNDEWDEQNDIKSVFKRWRDRNYKKLCFSKLGVKAALFYALSGIAYILVYEFYDIEFAEKVSMFWKLDVMVFLSLLIYYIFLQQTLHEGLTTYNKSVNLDLGSFAIDILIFAIYSVILIIPSATEFIMSIKLLFYIKVGIVSTILFYIFIKVLLFNRYKRVIKKGVDFAYKFSNTTN